MLITRKMPSFNGVQAGATATLNLPLVLSYYGWLINLNDNGANNALDLAKFPKITIRGDGRELYTVSAADLDKMNRHDNLPQVDVAANGGHLLYLPMIRHRMLQWEMQTYTVIGAGLPQNMDASNTFFNPNPLQTLQMEIEIASTASSPSVSALGIQGGVAPLGNLMKRRKFNYSATGTGNYEISDLPKGDLMDRIWIDNAASIDSVTLERDNFIVYERTREQNEFLQLAGVRGPKNPILSSFPAVPATFADLAAARTAVNAQRTPSQANVDAVDATKVNNVFDDFFVIDPCEFGFGTESIVTAEVNDFRLILKTNANIPNLGVYVDYIGGKLGN